MIDILILMPICFCSIFYDDALSVFIYLLIYLCICAYTCLYIHKHNIAFKSRVNMVCTVNYYGVPCIKISWVEA